MSKTQVIAKLDRIALFLTNLRWEVGSRYSRTEEKALLDEWMEVEMAVIDVERVRRSLQ